MFLHKQWIKFNKIKEKIFIKKNINEGAVYETFFHYNFFLLFMLFLYARKLSLQKIQFYISCINIWGAFFSCKNKYMEAIENKEVVEGEEVSVE